MKKIFQSALLLLCLGTASLSCKKFLDVTPKGYVIPQTVEDFDRIMNGQDLVKYMPTEMDWLSEDYYLAGAEKDPQDNNLENKAYVWHPYIYNSESDYQYYAPWTIIYRNIFQYNAVINNIDNATYGTTDQKKKIKGQAYFGRAWSYWQLVNLYSKHYNAATATTDMGVPLVTSNDINTTLPGRGTVKETYDFILADLAKAAELNTFSSLTKYRPSNIATQALLARTYLFMGDYANAKAAADKVLAQAGTLNNYNTIAQNTSPGRYMLTNNAGYSSNTIETNPEYIYINHYGYVYGMQNNDVSSELMSYLPTNDIRRMFLGYWGGVYYQNFFYYTNIGLGVPEMYLIRAEANARMNNLPAALDDINFLRSKRVTTASYVALTSTDKIQVTRWVLDERRRELFGKCMRWFDMRRLNSDPNFGFTARHYFDDGTDVSLAPGSNRYLLSIPATAINANIPQNPR